MTKEELKKEIQEITKSLDYYAFRMGEAIERRYRGDYYFHLEKWNDATRRLNALNEKVDVLI